MGLAFRDHINYLQRLPVNWLSAMRQTLASMRISPKGCAQISIPSLSIC